MKLQAAKSEARGAPSPDSRPATLNGKPAREYYDAFISYSHTDCKDIAGPIHKALQHVGKPWYKVLTTGLRIYRDQTDLSASPGFWPRIEMALHRANFLILLASPQAAKSEWIRKELGVWVEKNYSVENGLEKIIIVLCGGAIAWDEDQMDFDWAGTDCLPRELSGKFVNEPLWVDLRNFVARNEANQRSINFHDFGFSEQVAKVIGGIVNKPPAEIISRELQRVRKLRAVYIAAALVLILLLFTAISLFLGQRKANRDLQKSNVALVNQKKTSDSLGQLAARQRDTALQNLKRFKIEEFNRNVRNAGIYIDAQEYCRAKQVLDQALETIRDTLLNAEKEIKTQSLSVEKMAAECRLRCR